jgi:hypothetical protein
MELENCLNTTDSPNRDYDEHGAKDFVWATSEQAKLRALSLFLIRSIVESHGGTLSVDLATDTISIDVPEEEVVCAQEIEEQVGAMCC